MGRRLVVVRHGQTPWNAENRLQGQADVELAESGQVQAKAVAEALKATYRPAVLWCSDLRRAVQTAEAVGERFGLAPSTDPRLREIEVGELQGKTHDQAREQYGPGPWDYALYGGEGQAECGARVAAALSDIAVGLADEETAIVVSHGACIRLGAAAFLGWPADVARSLAGLENCGWVELVESAHGWRMGAYNRLA